MRAPRQHAVLKQALRVHADHQVPALMTWLMYVCCVVLMIGGQSTYASSFAEESVVKTVAPSPRGDTTFYVGEQVTYTLAVSIRGAPLGGSRLTDTLSPSGGLSNISWTCAIPKSASACPVSSGSGVPNPYNWGAGVTGDYEFTIKGTASQTGTITNSVRIDALPILFIDPVIEFNYANNSSQVSINVINRPTHAVRLTKLWSGGGNTDKVNLAISGSGVSAPVSGNSTNNGSTVAATATGIAGSTINLSETFTSGSASNYSSGLTCQKDSNGAAIAVTSNSIIMPGDSAVTCTFSNTALVQPSANVIIQKTWAANSLAGDQATVVSSGFGNNASSGLSTATPSGNTTTGTAVKVYVGETGSFAEVFSTGHPGNYTSTLACSGNSMPLSNGRLTIVSADTNKTIVCTVTNTRKTNLVTLTKLWQQAKTNDAVSLSIGGGISSTSGGSIAGGATTNATAISQAGDTISLNETYTTGSSANYLTTLSCVKSSDSSTIATAGNRFVMPGDSGVNCQFTNTRSRGKLYLEKTWSANSNPGDKVTISTSGFADNSSTLTSTALATGNTDNNQSAASIATIFAGETGTILETFNVGNSNHYKTSLLCGDAAGNNIALNNNQLTMPANTDIGCRFTNTRKIADLAITKTGPASVIAGQPMTYTIKVWNKGPDSITDAVLNDSIPANISGVGIHCQASGSASCGTPTSTGYNTYNYNFVANSNTRGFSGISLAPDASGDTNYVTFTISGMAYKAGTFTNTANVSSAAAHDPDSSNNQASHTISIAQDAVVSSGPAQCSAAQSRNILTNGGTVQYYDSQPSIETQHFTINNTGTVYGSAANGAIEVKGSISWSNGSPAAIAATATVIINGTPYAVLTTTGASSNTVAQWTALNGASITPATTSRGTYNSTSGSVAFTLILPTTVSNVTSAQIQYATYSPTGSYVGAGDDLNGTLTSIMQCQLPTVRIAKISHGGTGTFGFNNITNLTGASGAAITSDSIATTTAGTAASSSQLLYGSINTAVSISEIINSSYSLTSANCTDSNASASGNSGTFGTLTGNTLGIPASRLTYGANIICTFTNTAARVEISGRVFEDNSGSTGLASNAYNGLIEAGEMGIAGSTVKLTDNAGTVIATTQTDASGQYSFSVLPSNLPASFKITQSNISGYTSVSGSAGYNLNTDTITLSNTGAASYTNNNFGDARLNLIVVPSNQQTAIAGSVVDYAHHITSNAVLSLTSITQTASQQPAGSSDQVWQSVIYLDSNCSGKVDSAETVLSGNQTLLPNQKLCIVDRVNVPVNASGGAQHLVTLQAQGSASIPGGSGMAISSNSVSDTTLIGSAGLSMSKGVRVVASCPSTASDTAAFSSNNNAANLAFLEYEISYRNNSVKKLVNVSVKDSVPAGTVFGSMSCNSTPAGNTCTPTQSGEGLTWQMTGLLPPSGRGSVRFCVHIPALSSAGAGVPP